MYILGIETTGKYASVSILDTNKNEILDEVSSGEERSHLKSLIPMIDELLKRTNIDKKNLSYIACSVGPGSFTGIRIGVATSRALSQGFGIKCIAVPTLKSFMYKDEAIKKEKEGYAITTIIYARRMQVYGAIYYKGKYILEPGPYMLDDIKEKLKDIEKAYFLGDGVVFYKDYLNDSRYEFSNDLYQDSKSVNILGASMIDSAVGYNELEPCYMRITEAESKLMSGELKITKMRQE